jgi:cation transport regulator ChaC
VTHAASAHYLFAYGSLINRAARLATVPAATDAYPVIVRGVRRGWYFQYPPEMGPTLSPTYLGAEAEDGSVCNGVVFGLPAHPSELEALSWREQEYALTRLDTTKVQVVEGDLSLNDAAVWFYASTARCLPNETHPIVQSYVDECLVGCLEIEDSFPLAKEMGFARQFIETTDAWQAPWVNDRISPWRPSRNVPRAWDVDALLHEVLGADVYAQIRVPGF